MKLLKTALTEFTQPFFHATLVAMNQSTFNLVNTLGVSLTRWQRMRWRLGSWRMPIEL